MGEVTLTTEQILNLCEFAGIHVNEEKSDFYEEPEHIETEYTIYNSDYGALACIKEYPEKGSYPLSNHLKSKKELGGIMKTKTTGKFENKIIEVCAECGTASCWYGEFMCNDSRDADLTRKTVSELRKTHLENEENWSDEKMEMIYGDPAPYGYAVDLSAKCIICGKSATYFSKESDDYCEECSGEAIYNGSACEEDFTENIDTAEQAIIIAAGEGDAEASKKAFDRGEG